MHDFRWFRIHRFCEIGVSYAITSNFSRTELDSSGDFSFLNLRKYDENS